MVWAKSSMSGAGPDDAVLNVSIGDPGLHEADLLPLFTFPMNMTYNGSEDRYEFTLVGVPPPDVGDTVTVSSSLGGAYNAFLE